MATSKRRRDRRNRGSRPQKAPRNNYRADLFALLIFLALSAALYPLAHAAGLAAIISAAVALYVAFRGRR